ncbi:hypothetical protein E2C01_101302 [Portunus trituberculatus]|uniref:Uncharacterized protein n=1 Tax=Portunus trituberculatus TaxID=210409 RepID=A0A5B7KAC1_PORTR|nr:hypothetical protein [Portunus trituberculatus]
MRMKRKRISPRSLRSHRDLRPLRMMTSPSEEIVTVLEGERGTDNLDPRMEKEEEEEKEEEKEEGR